MRLPCHVVEDLLPLYHDGVCSEESKVLVDEHLAQCAACKDVLQSLKEEVVVNGEVDEAKPLAAFQAALKRIRWRALVKGAAIGVLACVLLAGSFWGLTQWGCTPVPSKDLEVSGVCQLENGWVRYEVRTNDRDSFGWYEYMLTEDAVLIWAKGMELPAASDFIGEVYGE